MTRTLKTKTDDENLQQKIFCRSDNALGRNFDEDLPLLRHQLRNPDALAVVRLADGHRKVNKKQGRFGRKVVIGPISQSTLRGIHACNTDKTWMGCSFSCDAEI
jgi:hypothetical protein